MVADGFRRVCIEERVTAVHAEFCKTYSVDLIADDAVYELKAVVSLNEQHQAQLLNYLFLLGLPRGKLINFRTPKVQGRIHATSLSAKDRHQIVIDLEHWEDLSNACSQLRLRMKDLLEDWGAFLACELYEQALTHFSGGRCTVQQRLPLKRDRIALGTQEFNIHAPRIAFHVTSVIGHIEAKESQLRRLLTLTNLQAIQWINLNHTRIQMKTLLRGNSMIHIPFTVFDLDALLCPATIIAGDPDGLVCSAEIFIHHARECCFHCNRDQDVGVECLIIGIGESAMNWSCGTAGDPLTYAIEHYLQTRVFSVWHRHDRIDSRAQRVLMRSLTGACHATQGIQKPSSRPTARRSDVVQ